MKVTPIAPPLPGEHLAATSPAMRPDTDDAGWRQRVNFWPGRSLTAEALELEQGNRSGRLSWRARSVTPGVVTGLEIGIEAPPGQAGDLSPAGHFIHVLPGYGILANGEDVAVPRPLRIPLDRIPIDYVRVGGADREAPGEPPLPGSTPGDIRDAGGFAFAVDRLAAGQVSWAAVVVLCPAEFKVFDRVDPTDPCELDPSRDAFADERRMDACVLRLCELPAAFRARPELGDPTDPRWRNRLAHLLFSEEAAQASRAYARMLAGQQPDRRWDTVLQEGGLFPWDLLGVPLALLAPERVPGTQQDRYFLDRAAVARTGGASRSRTRPTVAVATAESDATLHPRGAGTPQTWRAAVDQLAEQAGQLDIRTTEDVEQLVERVQFVPPVGLLPRQVLALLTTGEARERSSGVTDQPDRAGVNHLFPTTFDVEAVPVALEDLDAALASSAPLAPYDLLDEAGDDVRLLVPVPQRVFEPRLLLVEQEDPIFAETVARFVAARQDWRQRRDIVRGRRDALNTLIDGPSPAQTPPALEPGQLEAEPVETEAALGFGSALLSPVTTNGPWVIEVPIPNGRPITAASTLAVRMRIDLDAVPARIEIEWRGAAGELRREWLEPPAPPLERFEGGQPLATRLWLLFSATGEQLHATDDRITAVVVRVASGRVGLATIGEVVASEDAPREVFWWRADDPQSAPIFTNGDWTSIADDRLFAPFEDLFEPEFADGRTLTERVADVEAAINPPGVTERNPKLSVAADGLDRVIVELDAEANEADDFVDSYFTRAQVNLYRIRKLVLGETAAQKLLINPALATIAEQETAAASAEQLGAFVATAKGRKVLAADVNKTLSATASRAGGISALNVATGATLATATLNPAVTPAVNVGAAVNIGPILRLDPDVELNRRSGIDPRVRLDPGLQVDLKAALPDKSDALKDVLGQLPESGPTLPPRGLAIGRRFVEPPATKNLSYARSSLVQLVDQLPKLRLSLTDEKVKSISGSEVELLSLQGRTPKDAQHPGTPEEARKAAIAALLSATALTEDTDEAEVTLAALDFTEVQAAILRTIERVVQKRRVFIQTALETLTVTRDEAAAAGGRVLTLEGSLAEARHDVSVARALRQEEQKRIDGVNDRRDAIIRDEVKFVAYVRPRTVDPVRRDLKYWQLDPQDVQAPVPACLKRHDEPPVPLAAYVQLFRFALARWFPALRPLIGRLDTPDKLVALLDSARLSALSLASLDTAKKVQTAVQPVQLTVLAAHQTLSAVRLKSTVLQASDLLGRRWTDIQQEAQAHASVGDLIDGRHGSNGVSAAAAAELEQIGSVATCLHAEFAAVVPLIRLAWIERFSQFDAPTLLRDLTVLPQYGALDRSTRRRLQEFVDWLFGRIDPNERDAVALVNDLVRLCLLLASHAPVNRIIAGHVPRPTPVRPGIRIPITPINPELVRVGMEFHVWQASRVVARGLVEDLQQGAVTARVDHVEAQTTTLDTTMRVQFVAQGLSLLK